MDGYNTAGKVYVVKQNAITKEWSVVDFAGPDNDPSDTSVNFCSTGMAFDGTTLVVSGTAILDGSDNPVGGMYVYDFDGTAITFNTLLYSPDPQSNSAFSYEIAVNGNHIVTASYGYDYDGLSNVGGGFLYTKTGGTWDSGILLPYPTENVLPANKQFGYSIDFDGTTIVMGASGYGSSPTRGLLVVYGYNGTDWVVTQEILPDSSDFDNMGRKVAVDGNFLVTSSQSKGNIAMYELVNDVWTFKETITPTLGKDSLYPVSFGDGLSLSGNVLSVGYDSDSYAGLSSGSLRVFIYDGSTWYDNGLEREYYVTNSKGTAFTTYFTDTDGSSIITSAATYDTGNNNNVGRVYTVNLFETCTVSTDCSNPAHYCSPEELCVEPKACTTVSDCFGEFKSGRVAYCNTVAGVCQDKYAGTCTTAEGCRIKARQERISEAGIGKASVTISATNAAKMTSATNEMITRTKQSVTNPDDLIITVSGTETKEFTPDDVALDPNFADKVKAARCQDAEELCEVSVSGGRRLDAHGRVLQVDNITIAITYSIDETAYNATFDFDDPEFLQALADSIGVNVTDIDVSGDSSGNVVIEVTLTDESNGEDPLSEDLITQIQEINDNMDSIGDDLVSELGLDPSDIEQQALDLCLDRTCSGRGTCDENTGVCDCDGDWWGIDCETECSCENNGECDGAYCVCVYPFYGQRCADSVDCSC